MHLAYYHRNHLRAMKLFIIIFIFPFFQDVNGSFAKELTVQEQHEKNIINETVDLINQVFYQKRNFDYCRYNKEIKNNKCISLIEDGLSFWKLANLFEGLYFFQRVEVEYLNLERFNLALVVDCIEYGCQPYDLVSPDVRIEIAEHIRSGLELVYCIFSIEEKKLIREAKLWQDMYVKLKYGINNSSIHSNEEKFPEELFFADGTRDSSAFLFISSDQFRECRHLNTSNETLLFMRRLGLQHKQ